MIQFDVKANHILGGDITYINVGPNQYKFFLTIYRDCSGNELDPVYILNYKSTSCGVASSTFNVTKTGAAEEVSITCPSKQNTCNGGTELGIQKQVYSGTVTLPKTCTDWVISWDPGAGSKRNSAITNIVDPTNQNFYIEAKINNSQTSTNSSPQFTGMAFSYLYTNQKGVLSANVTDTDENTLTTKIVTPKTSATSTVTYLTGFSATKPVSNSFNAYNSLTGQLSITPSALEKSVTAFVVEEYQNGILIGSVMRDMQIITLSGANKIPVLSGINNTNADSINVCAGELVDFNIYGSDADASQKLIVTWDKGVNLNSTNGIDGLKTVGNGNKDTTNFKWQVPNTTTGSFIFNLTLTDDNCPLIGSITKQFKIKVFAKPSFNLANDSTINCSEKKQLLAYNLKGQAPFKYKWSTGDTSTSITVDPGNYKLTIIDFNKCSFADSISIKTGVYTFFDYDSLCIDKTTNFRDLSYSKSGAKITKWDWNFGDIADSTLNKSIFQNPNHQFKTEGNYLVKLKVEDEFGCKSDTSLSIHLCSKPIPNFEIVDTCKRKPATMKDLTITKSCGIMKYEFTFVNQSTNKIEKADYSFSKTPPYFPSNPLKNWLPKDSGTYVATMVAINENGCRNSITKKVHIRPQPIVHLKEKKYNFRCDAPDTILHVLDTATVKSSLPKGVTTWKPLQLSWTGGITTTFDTLFKHVSGPGSYSVKVTDMFGCDSIESVSIVKTIAANIGNWQQCKKGESVKFKDGSNSNWEIVDRNWSFGDGTTKYIASTKDTSILNTVHLYPSDGIYTAILNITDASTCTATDTLKVLVNTLTQTFSANPNPICVNSPMLIESVTGAYIDSIYWNFGDKTAYWVNQSKMTDVNNKKQYKGEHIFTKYGNGQYPILATTRYNYGLCYTTNYDTITLFPELKINLANPAGLCAGFPTKLNATRISGNPVTNWNWDIYYQESKPPYITTKLDSVNVPVSDVIGKTLNGQTRTFNNGGNYYIDLKVTNTDGCEFKINRQLFRILKLPVPTFCTDQLCATNPTKFSLFCGNKPEVSMNKYLWSFGDGKFATDADSTSHIYNSTGNYNVKVAISDTNYNCSKDTTIKLTIKSVPKSSFIADTVCYKLITNFIDKSSTIAGDTINKWYWNFGDGDTSEVQFPTHKYAAAGTYNVTLSATNKGKNCTKDYTYPVIVRPTPKAGFGYDILTVTAQKPITFTDSSSNDVNSWLYNFESGKTSTDQNPVYTFPYAGIYKVKQTVKNQYSCIDSISKDVDLNIYLLSPTGFSPNGDGLNDKFHPITRGVQKIDEIKLYNRWGELIWETNGVIDNNWDWEKHSWDGKYNGEDQAIGVYVYYATATSHLGEPVKVQGKITLIR